MSGKNNAIEKCKKLIALAEGTHSVNEAETALNIMKQIASKNNLRINPKTLERVESRINALRGVKASDTKVSDTKVEKPKRKIRKHGRDQYGRTMAQFIREHIFEGRDNDFILRALRNSFDVDKDNKYINWYRSQLRRQGYKG